MSDSGQSKIRLGHSGILLGQSQNGLNRHWTPTYFNRCHHRKKD